MQIPENPFEVNDLYEKAVEDIATDRLKSKNRKELLDMRQVFVAYHEKEKSFSTAAPYLLIIENEIMRRNLRTGFIVAVFTAVFAAIAAIAAWPVIREWIPTSQRGDRGANSQSPQSNSISPQQPAGQTSPVDTSKH